MEALHNSKARARTVIGAAARKAESAYDGCNGGPVEIYAGVGIGKSQLDIVLYPCSFHFSIPGECKAIQKVVQACNLFAQTFMAVTVNTDDDNRILSGLSL